MPTLIIAVLSLAAYATGAVIVRRRLASHLSTAVGPFELIVFVGAAVGMVLLRRPHYAIAHYVIWAAAMFLIGTITAWTVLFHQQRITGGTREFEDVAAHEPLASPWKRWIKFSRAVADYEFRLFLVACYLLLVGPIAVAFRFGRTEPDVSGGASTWLPKSDTPGVDAARRPF